MSYFAKDSSTRRQKLLFYPTLEDFISEDHPVRLFEELLGGVDWESWEQKYHGQRGRPPIHPRVIAGVILYGISVGIRSSRDLESACCNRLDFIWLTNNRRIDHSTFAKFRTSNEEDLKELGKHFCRVARALGFIILKETATDGTRIQADSSRHHTAEAKELEQWLEALNNRMDEAMNKLAANDAADDARYGEDNSPETLPDSLRDLARRRQLVMESLEHVKEVARDRKAKKGASAKEAKIPVSDPESRILPNKEGGFAPNYTPVVTVDGEHGFIIDEEVTNGSAEAPIQRTAVARIEETFDRKPDLMMGDGLYAESETIQVMEEEGIEFLAPVKNVAMAADAETYREEPDQPLAEELIEKLPKSERTGRFSREAFQYDENEDCFYCPRGNKLKLKWKRRRRQKHSSVYRRTYCADKQSCKNCPFFSHCVPSSQKYRRVECLDSVHEIERLAKKMKKAETKKQYARRFALVERIFGQIKHNQGIRRFLLRGLEKVNIEWKWICISYNIKKLVTLMGSQVKCVQKLKNTT